MAVVACLVFLIKTTSSESSSAFHVSEVRTGVKVKQRTVKKRNTTRVWV